MAMAQPINYEEAFHALLRVSQAYVLSRYTGIVPDQYESYRNFEAVVAELSRRDMESRATTGTTPPLQGS